MLTTLGWIGSILLATCSIPELIKALKERKCDLSWTFLLMWYFGEVFVFIPVLLQIDSAFLLANYALNVIVLSILILIKLKRF